MLDEPFLALQKLSLLQSLIAFYVRLSVDLSANVLMPFVEANIRKRIMISLIYETCCEKTCFLQIQKLRRRSATRRYLISLISSR